MRPITENRFWSLYKPIEALDGSYIWEYDDVQRAGIPLERVWSLIESDNDTLYAAPGYHVVNVLGYVITVEPWTDITRDGVYSR